MPSLIEPYQFGNIPEYKKQKTTLDSLLEVEPLLEKSAKGIKDYQDQQGRRREIDEAIANGNEGYEWFNADDPAMKAVVDEYVRTGNSSGIANQRSLWSQKQEAAKAAGDAQKYADMKSRLGLGLGDLYENVKAQHPDYSETQLRENMANALVTKGLKDSDAYDMARYYQAPAAKEDTGAHDEDYASAEVEASTVISQLTAQDPNASAATIMKDAAQKLCNEHPNLSRAEALKIVKSAVTEEKILASQQANAPKTPKAKPKTANVTIMERP